MKPRLTVMMTCLLAMLLFAAPYFALLATVPHSAEAEIALTMSAQCGDAQEYVLTSPEIVKTYRILVSAIGETPEVSGQRLTKLEIGWQWPK